MEHEVDPVLDALNSSFKDLNKLKDVLASLGLCDWDQEMEKIENQIRPPATIGVFGPSGSGKSTLLNAIVGSTIIPVHCGRACTATPIQIKYHSLPTTRARISFITHENWLAELRLLQNDLKSPSDKLDAEIAWEKIHAVHPELNIAQAKQMSYENFTQINAGIHQLFGTKVHVTGATPEEFLAAIGQYATGSPKYENGQAPPSLWPIVSEIVISHRSNALSTGAVLVDLPGVADSNAARNEVCKRFIQKSDYLWFVVDIVRAADNEMILKLLDKALRDQLKNQRYNSKKMTFIATRSDIITIEDAIFNYGLANDPDVIRLRQIVKENSGSSIKQSTLRIHAGSKRPHSHNPYQSDNPAMHKRLKPNTSKHEQMDDMLVESDDDEELTNSQLDSESLNGLIRDRCKVEAQQKLQLIFALSRNKEASLAIKQQFIDSLTAIDEMIAEGTDPDNYDPDDSLRDYTTIDVPVYICSATDFRRLAQDSDDAPACYVHPEETGIPQLQQWCHVLAAPVARKHAARSLNKSYALALSTEGYVANSGLGSERDQAVMRKRWQTGISDLVDPDIVTDGTVVSMLYTAFRKEAEDWDNRLRTIFKDRLTRSCNAGATIASDVAHKTTAKLLDEIRHQTLKAQRRSWALGVVSSSFENDLFFELEKAIRFAVDINVKKYVEFAPTSLKQRAENQADVCRKRLDAELPLILDVVSEAMAEGQRTASRVLAPSIQEQLRDTYAQALLERGKGSVARRQGVVLLDVTNKSADGMFVQAADGLMQGLDSTVEGIRKTLELSLACLAHKIEDSFSVLWDGKTLLGDRRRALTNIKAITKSLEAKAKMASDFTTQT